MSEADTKLAPTEEAQATSSIENQESAQTTAPVSDEDNVEVEQAAAKDAPAEETKETSAAPEAAESQGSAKVLKTKGRIDFENPRNNRKFDPTSREVTDDPKAIRKQVEFYFGDWNLPQDKFMWETSEGPENKPIPVKTIHSFKRMRTFQPYTAVVAALRDSDFLEVGGEEGEETLTRKVAYKPMASGKAKAEAATVYVKGFGDETPNTQFDLESFFSKFGDVKGLKLRRTNEDFFKGSVFVTFADEETAKKFMELDPAPKWNEHDLKIMSKRAYCQEKSDLIRQGKIEPSSQNSKRFYEGKIPHGKDKGFQDRDDWKNRREYDQKNGFRDRRDGGRGRGRGRGGRGRGGRGRDGGRDRDGGRHGGRGDKDRTDNAPSATEDPKVDATYGKRARDDDVAAGEPAAKKVDVKES